MTSMMLRCFIFLAASADADMVNTLQGRGPACESSGVTCGSGFIQTRKMLGGQQVELGAELVLAEITAVSYNLYWWNVGANNRWNELWSRISSHKPMDLIGFQECEDVARVVQSSGLSGFEFWQGPNKPQANPAPLAWNTGVFAKLSGPGSVKVGQDQYGDRIVTWVRLRHLASNQALFFANTHGPLNGCGNDLGDNWVAAVNSHQESGDLVIMTGDFNCGIGSAAMNKIKNILPGGVDGGIDFILTRGMDKISGGNHNGYPSDHPLVKGSFNLADAGTAPPPPSATTTTAVVVTGTCYGELSNVAVDEGEGIGSMDTTSVQDCKQRCSESSQCQSFAFCPTFAGCYFKSKAFAGNEPTRVFEDCNTFYKKSCDGSSSITTTSATAAPTTPTSSTTTTNTPDTAESCYGELSHVAVDEGEEIGEMDATSAQECKQSCLESSQCQSFAYCPIWAGCWFKRKAFAGNEPTRVLEDCKTYYKSSCEGSSSTSATANTAQPTTTTLPATSAAPVVATTTTTSLPVSNSCFGDLSYVAVDEGEGVGSLETTSLEDCKQRCSESSQCQSFAFCPIFAGCWFKNKTFVGNEPTRIVEDCRTHYKRSCADTTPPSPTPTASSASVTVMTYNTVYTGYPCCGSNTVPQFGRKIDEVGPAVMGAQECQDKDLLANAAGYQVVPGTGFQNPILYDDSKVALVAGSGGWMDVPKDCYAQRTVTWAKFTMKNGMGFYFFNTHLPHNGCEAQSRDTHAQIATMLLQKREQLGAANVPTAVVCDCNPFASDGSSRGSFESVLASGGIRKAYEARGTQGGYAGLDKIFASMDWTPSNGADHGTGSSDHPAITADLMLAR